MNKEFLTKLKNKREMYKIDGRDRWLGMDIYTLSEPWWGLIIKIIRDVSAQIKVRMRPYAEVNSMKFI